MKNKLEAEEVVKLRLVVDENKGLSEKLDSEEKEKIMDALKDGQSWIDSNP